jgi:hypothetical protein
MRRYSASTVPREGIYQRAIGRFALVTALDCLAEHAFHRFEVGDLCPHISEMSAGKVSDFDARLMPALGGESEQGADFIEGGVDPVKPDTQRVETA